MTGVTVRYCEKPGSEWESSTGQSIFPQSSPFIIAFSLQNPHSPAEVG